MPPGVTAKSNIDWWSTIFVPQIYTWFQSNKPSTQTVQSQSSHLASCSTGWQLLGHDTRRLRQVNKKVWGHLPWDEVIIEWIWIFWCVQEVLTVQSAKATLRRNYTRQQLNVNWTKRRYMGLPGRFCGRYQVGTISVTVSYLTNMYQEHDRAAGHRRTVRQKGLLCLLLSLFSCTLSFLPPSWKPFIMAMADCAETGES
jgi:hypothetical protein